MQDVLPLLRAEPHWAGAAVEHLETFARITTHAQPWHYAAAIAIPPLVSAMKEPHLRLCLQVESGRIGILAIWDENGSPCGEEQFVGPHTRPVQLTVELPAHAPTTVVLRNTVETAGRAVVLEASLCDRSV